MAENKLYNSLSRESEEMPERLAVKRSDGTLMFLEGEAIQRYKNGELDLDHPKLTPEQEKELAKMGLPF